MGISIAVVAQKTGTTLVWVIPNLVRKEHSGEILRSSRGLISKLRIGQRPILKTTDEGAGLPLISSLQHTCLTGKPAFPILRLLKRLALGKVPDFVVLSDNSLKMSDSHVSRIEVEATIVGGEVVYRKDDKSVDLFVSEPLLIRCLAQPLTTSLPL
jgi:hypothetical protein